MIRQRKHWIDLLRGICMIAILLDHTEIYYTGINIIDYNVYVVNALTIFFMLSGYLMYKETGFDFRNKMKSITLTLLLPYFIFSTLILFPKNLIHGNEINFMNILEQIILGQASWFIASLCIAEVFFATSIWITRGKDMALFIVSMLGFSISIYLSQGNQPYPWQIDNSLQALLFIWIGYTYHKYEKATQVINRISYTSLLSILLICIKIYEKANDVNMLVCPISINNYPVFLLDILICSLMMVQISKRLPPCKWLEWTGSHSLVYYFLCGGVPLITSKVLDKIGLSYDGNYLYVMVALLIVYVMTTFFTWIIYRYFPFTIGKKYGKNTYPAPKRSKGIPLNDTKA